MSYWLPLWQDKSPKLLNFRKTTPVYLMKVDSFHRDTQTQTCLLDSGIWHIKYSCLTHSGSEAWNMPVWCTEWGPDALNMPVSCCKLGPDTLQAWAWHAASWGLTHKSWSLTHKAMDWHTKLEPDTQSWGPTHKAGALTHKAGPWHTKPGPGRFQAGTLHVKHLAHVLAQTHWKTNYNTSHYVTVTIQATMSHCHNTSHYVTLSQY